MTGYAALLRGVNLVGKSSLKMADLKDIAGKLGLDNVRTYIVEVVPIRTETWKAGVYIFAVAVARGPDQGQALCKVKMD